MRAAGFARRRAQQRPQLPAQAEQPPAVARLQGQPQDGTRKHLSGDVTGGSLHQAARCTIPALGLCIDFRQPL